MRPASTKQPCNCILTAAYDGGHIFPRLGTMVLSSKKVAVSRLLQFLHHRIV